MRTNPKLSLVVFILFVSGILFFLSCNKSSSGSNVISRLELRLTDDPAVYDAVYIDIQKVEVNASSDTGTNTGWQSLPVLRPGVYNLLNFRNGIDTLLAAMDLPAGKLSQIRLILGDNNSLVVNGQSFTLTVPSGQQSGLKLNIDATLTAGIVYRLWIDFDASRSIVAAGNSGKYLLKPVLRTYSEAMGGSIKGFVLPVDAQPQVWAVKGTDTLLALPDPTNGYYFVGGVNAGSWNLLIHAGNTAYTDTSFAVTVSTGEVANAGVVTLGK